MCSSERGRAADALKSHTPLLTPSLGGRVTRGGAEGVTGGSIPLLPLSAGKPNTPTLSLKVAAALFVHTLSLNALCPCSICRTGCNLFEIAPISDDIGRQFGVLSENCKQFFTLEYQLAHCMSG